MFFLFFPQKWPWVLFSSLTLTLGGHNPFANTILGNPAPRPICWLALSFERWLHRLRYYYVKLDGFFFRWTIDRARLQLTNDRQRWIKSVIYEICQLLCSLSQEATPFYFKIKVTDVSFPVKCFLLNGFCWKLLKELKPGWKKGWIVDASWI